MPGPHPFDDAAIDAVLAGTARGADASGLASFVEDLRAAAVTLPTPTPALAAAIAAGGISTQPPVAKWRNVRMKIQGFLAGLGIAGKVALGMGVAAAATTGAGAAGVLPDPVQHAVSKAIGAISPFSLPDPDHHGGSFAGPADTSTTTTSTTVADTTTTEPKDDGHGAVTPTTAHHGDGHDGKGDNTTPTSKGPGDADNPELLSIACEWSANPVQIVCHWTASPNADHASYVLLRSGGPGEGRVVVQTTDGLTGTDTTVQPDTNYVYRVDSLRADGSVEAHSPAMHVECCGELPSTTTSTTEHHGGDGTTTTTVPHGDGTTTSTTAGGHH